MLVAIGIHGSPNLTQIATQITPKQIRAQRLKRDLRSRAVGPPEVQLHESRSHPLAYIASHLYILNITINNFIVI